jgi:hypothetical protein
MARAPTAQSADRPARLEISEAKDPKVKEEIDRLSAELAKMPPEIGLR